jgi:hypothetical protein
MTNADHDAKAGLPDQLHILFERGLFLGAFRSRDAAVRLQEARTAGGKPPPELATYQRIDEGS